MRIPLCSKKNNNKKLLLRTKMLQKLTLIALLAMICPLLSMDAPMPMAKAVEAESKTASSESNDLWAEPDIAHLISALNSGSNMGNTPLHLAATVICPNLIQRLLASNSKHKNDLNAYNGQGLTPLLLARYKANPEADRALIEAGADTSLLEKWDLLCLKK